MMKRVALSIFLAFLGTLLPASSAQSAASASRVDWKACSACIRAHEEFLASDAMQGRGSGTHDEFVAATYIASQLRQYGIAPAGDDGGYIQRAPTIQRKVTAPPQLELTPPAGTAPPISWTYGKEFVSLVLSQSEFSGPLRKLDAAKILHKDVPKIQPGSIVFVVGDEAKVVRAAFALSELGVAAALLPSKAQNFDEKGGELPTLADALQEDSGHDLAFNALRLSAPAGLALEQMPDGTMVHFRAAVSETKAFTWNAVGILRGTEGSLQHAAILLSAHLDHLGVGKAIKGDSIYNGADDDASGTTAVLELARFFGSKRRPHRTVIFALFGSEEMGGLGSTYFRAHPPVSLTDLSANLEFEMLGRPDAAVKPGTLWITGWERSNLGPALAAHGAQLVGDPHPEEDFFARSDNFVLAKKGVIAQTISSYGLHKDYHRPSDDLAHLDLKHMDEAIGSLLAPIDWLVNSDFQPKWNARGKP